MKLSRLLERLPDLASRNVIPQGAIDEVRLFALGAFNSTVLELNRVVEVVEGLREHVGQPFGLHPCAFTLDYSTMEDDGLSKPATFIEVVRPQSDGAVYVSQFFALPKRLHFVNNFLFRHGPDGTTAIITPTSSQSESPKERAAISNYPLAIAVLITRGCSVDLKRAPSVVNARRRRLSKTPIPAHYNVDAGEYLSALGSELTDTDNGGTHASPIPHLRRAHERVLSSGKRVWVSSALVNVRSEGDIAFVERRKAYERA
ncbi:hypothetical protein [Ruegeria arenilitoris]|uniref:hypothetical protein n=1 Tax=Ruegeria arenilitoris TaxID=1173585 RepID=UPI00147D20F2|nr:hypothetical protein [Ruegeria arenilitoris]